MLQTRLHTGFSGGKFLFGLLQFGLAFVGPKPGGGRVAFKLRECGVELGFAMINLLLPQTKMFGKLLGLPVKLFGRLFFATQCVRCGFNGLGGSGRLRLLSAERVRRIDAGFDVRFASLAGHEPPTPTPLGSLSGHASLTRWKGGYGRRETTRAIGKGCPIYLIGRLAR